MTEDGDGRRWKGSGGEVDLALPSTGFSLRTANQVSFNE